jgi:hypothetical protein
MQLFIALTILQLQEISVEYHQTITSLHMHMHTVLKLLECAGKYECVT